MSNLQENLHNKLNEYADHRQRRGEAGVGGDIPSATLMIFVGNRIRREAVDHIIPEMKRHWPISFSESGQGRLLFLFVDRNNDDPIDETGICEHYCLTAEGGSTLENRDDDCRRINACMGQIMRKANGPDLSRMRLVVVTCVEDPDSLITGEIMAIAKKHGHASLLHDNIATEGRLFAFLPDSFRSRKEAEETKEFFLKLMQWQRTDLPKNEAPAVYMPYEDDEAERANEIGAIVSHTLLFDSRDSYGVSDTIHWRDELLVDVLETDAATQHLVQSPGIVQSGISYEYVLLEAMEPSRWNGLGGSVKVITDPEQIRGMMVRELGDISEEIQRWLGLVCVARAQSDDGAEKGIFSVKEAEEYYFGSSISGMFGEFKKTLEKKTLPRSIQTMAESVGNTEQAKELEKSLNKILETTREDMPEGAFSRTPLQPGFTDVWALRDNMIIPLYKELASGCVDAMVHKWAKDCSVILQQSREKIEKSSTIMLGFEEIRKHEIKVQKEYWRGIDYNGPEMEPIRGTDAEKYRNLVTAVMKRGSDRDITELLEFADSKVKNPNVPHSEGRVRVMCHLYDARGAAISPAYQLVINSGVSKGRKITFSNIENLALVRLLSRFRELSRN